MLMLPLINYDLGLQISELHLLTLGPKSMSSSEIHQESKVVHRCATVGVLHMLIFHFLQKIKAVSCPSTFPESP